jgi:hypothetical protein
MLFLEVGLQLLSPERFEKEWQQHMPESPQIVTETQSEIWHKSIGVAGVKK